MRFALLFVVLFVTPLFAADPEKVLFDALTSEKATQKGEYPFVRSAVAAYFEQTRATDIRAAFGDDFKPITDLLAANPDLRDLLYTAIDPKADDVRAALGVFRDLYKLGPDKLKAHPQLAVALAVVWDTPKTVYSYHWHQERTKSTLPEAVAITGAAENYRRLLTDEKGFNGAVAVGVPGSCGQPPYAE